MTQIQDCKIELRTKKISDQDLALKFFKYTILCLDLIKNDGSFISLERWGKKVDTRLTPKHSYLNLNHKSQWIRSINLEYKLSKESYPCYVSVSSKDVYHINISIDLINSIIFHKDKESSVPTDTQFMFLDLIKRLSKQEKKRLIRKFYYLDSDFNWKSATYFINTLIKKFNLSLKFNWEPNDETWYVKSFERYLTPEQIIMKKIKKLINKTYGNTN